MLQASLKTIKPSHASKHSHYKLAHPLTRSSSCQFRVYHLRLPPTISESSDDFHPPYKPFKAQNELELPRRVILNVLI